MDLSSRSVAFSPSAGSPVVYGPFAYWYWFTGFPGFRGTVGR
jgi:hypothetical protein